MSERNLAPEPSGANTQLVSFDFDQHQVRAFERDGELWIVAKDAAEALGYSDTDQAIRKHCKAAKTYPVETTGQVRHLLVIPERDVYRLIMKSKLPAAERFEELVVGEILPSIRKTGSYGGIDLENPAHLRAVLLDYTEKVIALESEVKELQPKAEGYERIALADGSLCITDAAKTLGMRRKDLFAWLQQNKWAYRRAGNLHLVGYQTKLQQCLLEMKVHEVTRADGSSKITEQCRVTPKGLAKLAEIFSATEDAA